MASISDTEKPSVECVETVESTQDTSTSIPILSAAEERKLWRKIDMRLMPMLSLMYLMSFLDRGNIGNAKLQGLTDQLHLTGNKYNIALTMYFVPYCLCECPANLLLKMFRPSRWLSGITIVWGIIMILMGIVKTYPQLVGVRILLGVAEAGLFPGVCFYLSMWYPRHLLQYRIALFFGAASAAGAFSGLLAFGISFMSGTDGLLGWSWIFIIEGLATVVVGVISAFVLVDYPDTAKFLTPGEREWIAQRTRRDHASSGGSESFALEHVIAAFTDWQIYFQSIVYFSISVPLYGISLFLPSIINGFGFNTTITQLLTVPPYVFATIVLLSFAIWSDRLKMRSPFIIAGLALCVVGFAINISNAAIGAKYFGTFLVLAGAYGGFPGVVAWLGNNIEGQYKRAVGMALHLGIGGFGGAIAANIYRSEDAPRYVLGHAVELGFVSAGFVSVPLMVLVYRRVNARRQLLMAGEGGTEKERGGKGDKALEFRYTL